MNNQVFMKPKRKPRKMKPYTARWESMAAAVAYGFAPQIYPCVECGGPVAMGYCCSRCGSDDPSNRVRENDT